MAGHLEAGWRTSCKLLHVAPLAAPNWPWSSAPQQLAAPDASSAHV
ncbi:MAG TPA: hypothetical protein VJO52_08315 [Gemmatimonadaceae bacterium]|nr:hypothetical protein [Gemmatimonadaceae bacterium]